MYAVSKVRKRLEPTVIVGEVGIEALNNVNVYVAVAPRTLLLADTDIS